MIRVSFWVLVAALVGAVLAGSCSQRSVPAGTESQGKPSPTPAGPAHASSRAPLVVTGETILVSKVPEPGTAPYTECLTAIKYRVTKVEKGHYDKPELLAIYWGMKGNKLMPAARFREGEQHRLELEPLSKHPELERTMQADDTNEYNLIPYWVLNQ